MTLRPFLIPLLSLALLAQPVHSQTATEATAETTADPLPSMEAIEAAWAAEDFTTVRAGLKRLAEEEGSSLAQYRYGRVLLEGRGGPIDPKAAALWLEQAVAQNHLPAATLLARIYLTGLPDSNGQPQKDPARAAALLRNAAARGAAEAQYYLALLYQAGNGIAADAEAAFNWLQAAAEQGYGPAQQALSDVYKDGNGTAADPALARYWLKEASHFNDPKARFDFAQMLLEGYGGEIDRPRAVTELTAAAEAGLVMAQRQLGMLYLEGADPALALQWLEQAAANGDLGAMSNLGHAYATGQGLAQDDAAALRWYRLASENGLGRATTVLARFQEVGRGGLTADADAAVTLYMQAVDQGSRTAALRLGQLVVSGDLTGDLAGRLAPQQMLPWVLALLNHSLSQDDAAALDQSLRWLEQVAQAGRAGTAPAMAALATYYRDGPNPDPTKALQWLQQAAQAGQLSAQVTLGQRHSIGDGVDLDYVAAHRWLNIAATRGHGEAAQQRDTLTALMTPDQLAEAQASARRYFAEEEPQPPATDQVVLEQIPAPSAAEADE